MAAPLRRLGSRALVSALRLPSRRLPIPGWFPLVVEQLHPHVTGEAVADFEQEGIRMRLDLREYTQRRIFYGAHEPGEVTALRRLLRPRDAVLDVGAHVGFFTLLAADAVGPDGAVHAFEPVPENFRSLAVNVDLNRFEHVVLNRVAVGRAAGHVQLGTSAEAGSNTGGFTVGGAGQVLTVESITLDDYVTDRLAGRDLRLVKIDVEGAEPHVLAGFAGQLRERPPHALMLEVSVDALAAHGFGVRDVVEPLAAAGYALNRIGPRGRRRPLREADVEAPPQPLPTEPTRGAMNLVRQGLRERRTFFNLLALHESHA